MSQTLSGKHKRLRWILVASVAITGILYMLPPPWGPRLAFPFVMISTLAHEMGHGITAILLGGEFHKFSMWADGSGVAITSGYSGRLANALVPAGGLVGPAIVGAIFFVLSNKAKWAKASVATVGILLLFADIWVVRSLFGLFFVGLLGALFVWIAFKAPKWASQFTLVLVAVQLALSVFSRGDYLFMKEAHTSSGIMPSDVSRMSAALFLPYWFWGAACGAFSLFVLYWGIKFFFKTSILDD